MKNLKALLFVGLITLSSNAIFAQSGNDWSKFGTETDHKEYRSEDNSHTQTQNLNIIEGTNSSGVPTWGPGQVPMKDNWMQDVTEFFFIGLF